MNGSFLSARSRLHKSLIPKDLCPASPSSVPVPSAPPKESFRSGFRYRLRPLRVFGPRFRRNPESARTTFLKLRCLSSDQVSPIAGKMFLPYRYRIRHIPRNRPMPPSDRIHHRFRDNGPPAVPHHDALASDGRSLDNTAGFRRRAGLPGSYSGVNRTSVLQKPSGHAASLHRIRECLIRDGFRCPDSMVLGPPKRLSALSISSDPPFR